MAGRPGWTKHLTGSLEDVLQEREDRSYFTFCKASFGIDILSSWVDQASVTTLSNITLGWSY
jgi:hypothetical protein